MIPPPAGRIGFELRRGQTLRIVDVEGKQVPDLVCFNLDDPRERLSTNNSRLVQKRWLLTTVTTGRSPLRSRGPR